eukprot:487854_1
MSDYIPPKYIDNYSKNIIEAYIRQTQTISSPLLINHYPSEIIQIILAFIDDHLMIDRCTAIHEITDPILLENILHAPYNTKFTLDPFEFGKLQWLVTLYPNGCPDVQAIAGQFCVFIELLSIPRSWENITVCQTIECKQFNVKFIDCPTYSDDGSYWGWNEDALPLNDVITANINHLKFCVSMKILRIVGKYKSGDKPYVKFHSAVSDYKKQYNFNLCLNANSLISARIYSEIVGEMFFAIYNRAVSCIILKICGMPKHMNVNISAVQIKWTVSIECKDLSYSNITKLGYGGDLTDQSNINICRFDENDFKEMNEILIGVVIEILEEYDFDGNTVQMNVDNEWNKFILKRSNDVVSTEVNDLVINGDDVCRKGVEMLLGNYLKLLKTQNMLIERMCLLEREIGIIKNGSVYDEESDDIKEFKVWLKDVVKLEQYLDVLIVNGFDSLDAIKTVNIKQLEEIGIYKIGHRQKLMKNIQMLPN